MNNPRIADITLGLIPSYAPPLGNAVERLWIVRTPSPDTLAEMWTDPAYTDDETRLDQFCGAEPNGYDIDQFVLIYWGGDGHLTWNQEASKLYTDAAAARQDAVARLEKAKAKYGPKD